MDKSPEDQIGEIMTAAFHGEITFLELELRIRNLIHSVATAAKLETWESCKCWIESSNIMVCGDARGAPDVKASINFYKKALTLRADEMIKKLKGYE